MPRTLDDIYNALPAERRAKIEARSKDLREQYETLSIMPDFDETGCIRELADTGEIVLQQIPGELFTDDLPRFQLLDVPGGSAGEPQSPARLYAEAAPRDGRYIITISDLENREIGGISETPAQAAWSLWWHRHMWR